jgi:thiol-disulfide isomerase/thioredoxin
VRRALAGLATVAATLLLAACLTTTTSTSGSRTAGGASEVSEGRVDVDTPALGALKASARIAACSPGTSTSRLPEVTLPCLGGGPAVDLARLRGPMVINLFADWCTPCRGELPYFQRLHEDGRDVVGVLGVDYLDPDPGPALELARSAGVTYPLLADPGGALRTPLRIRGLPGVVLLRRNGTVATVQFRVFRSYAELRALVQQRLGVTLGA